MYLPLLLVYLFAYLLPSLADKQCSMPKIQEKNVDDAILYRKVPTMIVSSCKLGMTAVFGAEINPISDVNFA